MTHTINKVEDPAAVLAIPTDEDVEVVEKLLQRGYDDVADDYESMDADEMPEWLATKGSLMQELLAQLHQ